MKKVSINNSVAGCFALLMVVFIATRTHAQEISTREVKNKELLSFAANPQVVGEHRGKTFLIRLFKVANAASPFAEDSDEVDHFLYLLVVQYGETESVNDRLYKVGPLFYPKKFSWGSDPKSGKEILAFTYLTNTEKTAVIYISLDSLRFIRQKP